MKEKEEIDDDSREGSVRWIISSPNSYARTVSTAMYFFVVENTIADHLSVEVMRHASGMAMITTSSWIAYAFF